MIRPASRTRHKTDANKIRDDDRPVHDWYRFVLSYPPHLVRDYLHRFEITQKQLVLDPFCGTGTTLVECKKLGIASTGIEANPMAHLACRVKTDWAVEPDRLYAAAHEIATRALAQLNRDGFADAAGPANLARLSDCRTLPVELGKLILADSISPLPLHKTLLLLDCLDRSRTPYQRHLRLALAKVIVFSISNLHFGPEVGVGKKQTDCPVIAVWLSEVGRMADDLRQVRARHPVASHIHHGDARDLHAYLTPNSLDAVITSPPYPNEKDYTRTTRLESVLLGLIRSKDDLRQLKRLLVRSNTRGVYKADEDDAWVADHPEIQRIAAAIEARRIELGKTSGFERLYARVTRLYFGGMRRHLANLRPFLKPGAQLAYVVGDQASYLRVMIRTGQLLADLAKSLGYEVVSIDTFRTRIATATRARLAEEVLVLRWP
jgi:DNA modification methylase